MTRGNVIVFIRENIQIDKNTNEETLNIFREALKSAELESKNISDRVKLAKRYLESKGYYTGSIAPVGYKKIKSTNGRYKLIMDSNIQHIIKFISACKSKGTTIDCLNKLLSLCSADIEQPLILDNNTNQLLTDLTYENIASILNDYSVGDRKWNKTAVAKLHKKSKLEDAQREESVDSIRKDSNKRLDGKDSNKRLDGKDSNKRLDGKDSNKRLESENIKNNTKTITDHIKSNKRKIIKIKSSRIKKKRKTTDENDIKDKIEIPLLEERQDNLDTSASLPDRITSIKDNTLDVVSYRLRILRLNNKKRKRY
jgi:hypothetical protein